MSIPRPLLIVLALLALVSIATPAWLVVHAPDVPARIASKVKRPQRVVPKAEVPEVEPIEFQELAPQDARAYNASIPFSTAPNPAARPFRIFGTPEDRARAVDCLAAAVIYEAGDDATGEKAVAQVVLNRVRHPAFPKTVCGVVFQGSERKTGCQFTFTCDGAMMRSVVPAAWERARAIATAALTGTVDRRVGHATHYHTDWVVPYWSASLDKITEVHTHLFFRWSGWWGTPPAFNRAYAGAEPTIVQLARLSPAHANGVPAEALAVTDPALAGTAIPKGLEQDENSFLVTLDPKLTPDTYPALAQRTCGDRPYCKFMAWSARVGAPAALPITPVQQRAMGFSYLRDRAFGFEKALWNCAEFKRDRPVECMKAQLSITMAAPPPRDFTYDAAPGSVLKGIAGADATRPTGPDPLTGVRRKSTLPDRVPMILDEKTAPVVAPPPAKATRPARD
jgi:spore germination cell wall hydrolase CwlJ-like protein